MALLQVPARRFRTNRRTNRACGIEEGLLLAEAPGLMLPTFRRRHFRLENSVRARTLFRRTQGLSADARSISQAVVEAAVRLPHLPAPIDASNLQRTSDEANVARSDAPALDFE
jgi:hypothetical protein